MKLPLWIKWIFFSIIIFTSLVLPLTFLEPSLANYGDLALEWAGSNKLLISFIVILALTADVLLPVPNGLTNTFAGMSLGWGISSFVVWIGLNMGAILAYSIGRFAGRPLAKKLISSGLPPPMETFARHQCASYQTYRDVSHTVGKPQGFFSMLFDVFYNFHNLVIIRP